MLLKKPLLKNHNHPHLWSVVSPPSFGMFLCEAGTNQAKQVVININIQQGEYIT
jgi:hypothetical protein